MVGRLLVQVIDVNNVAFANTLVPILVTESGISIVPIPELVKHSFPICLRSLGKQISFRLVQFLKAELPMDVYVSGSVILLSPFAPQKAYAGIAVTPVGTVSSFSLVQPTNGLS